MTIEAPLANRFRRLGEREAPPIAVTVQELVRASQPNSKPALLLPSIQRSLVWGNERIVNFWDSLFRGYPVGTLMVHLPGRDVLGVEDHQLTIADDGDLALFDGQQRLHALRVGFGLEISRRKLWIDLGQVENWLAEGTGAQNLCLPLRISGPGQPFGYQADKPNQKYNTDELRAHLNKYPAERAKAWATETDAHLIDAVAPVPLAWFFDDDHAEKLDELTDHAAPIAAVRNRVTALAATKLLLVPVPQSIVEDPDAYRRFFERIGQGGVSLSDKELAYSIIKQRLPHVRAQMQQIEGVGRIADEVDLVLGCFRIARLLDGRTDLKPWQRSYYPSADQLKGVDFRAEADDTARRFTALLPTGRDPGKLKLLFEGLCRDLLEAEVGGLPPMLLSHIDGELWHVLMLLAHCPAGSERASTSPHSLSTFALWWMLFVWNGQKAARSVFSQPWRSQPPDLPALVRAIQGERAARLVLGREKREEMLTSIVAGADLLEFDKRFGGDEALRHWADNPQTRRRALIWLQRSDLAQWPATKDFNPASDYEDDLPIEFDHLIPQAGWAGRWDQGRVAEKGLAAFEGGRWHCGNSIGNFRIMTSSLNAARGKNPLTDRDVVEDGVQKLDDGDTWIRLSQGMVDEVWTAAAIRDFQYVTQRRTLQLYARLVEDSGIDALLRDAASALDPSPVTEDGPELEPEIYVTTC